MEDQGYYFSSFVCAGSFWCQLPVSDDKNVLLFLVQGGYLSHRKFYGPVLGKKAEVRDLFLHLLFLKCLQIKMIICQSSVFGGSMFQTPSSPLCTFETLISFGQLLHS